jgi:pyruvate formate lyase activating enzyme
MDALYAEMAGDKVRCRLCPHQCIIGEGQRGLCKVRRNVGGKLRAESWGNVSALNMDPIEKKPLYHFYPGTSILSVGSIGCNMHCTCCQNWQISQVTPDEYQFGRRLKPAEIITIAKAEKDNLGIAYTYNEPAMGFEYIFEISRLAKDAGLKNAMVSNGFLQREPLEDLLEFMDAFNIDLKGFTEDFYHSFTGASLQPVLNTLQQIRNSGRHLEVTCLIIPSQNDDPETFTKMIEWIESVLGKETVLHLSRYHPAYKLGIEPTSASNLGLLLSIARKRLFHVYAGNIQLNDYQDTRCSKCGKIVIKRAGYHTNVIALEDDGACKHCGKHEILR